MIEWKIKIADGPDGEVVINKETLTFDSRLALSLKGEYLAVYLTAREARLIAKALLESVVGVKRHEKRHPKTPRWLAKQIW